jgi:putative sterol carrier protein
MTTARAKIEEMAQKLAAKQTEASAINAVYKFVLEGEGGGTWIVKLKAQPSISEGEGDAECVLRLSASDFVDMVEGRKNGQQLFFMGKLRIEGDMGLALRLESLIQILK